VGIKIPTRALLVSHRWFSERGYFEAGEIYRDEEYEGEEYEGRDDVDKIIYQDRIS
jgi:hypothetical protein